MTQNAIRAIVFDLGRVLIDFDHTIAAKRMAQSSGKSVEEIYNLFFDSDLTQRFEAGEIDSERFWRGVCSMLSVEIPFDTFAGIWNEIFFLTDKNRQVYALVKQLKSRYNTALLSNINAMHFEYIKRQFPLFDVFHHVLPSCELGFIKPDPRIYKKTLQILGCQGQEVVYTDDRPELIVSAKQLGIRGFVFSDVDTLKKDLISSGVVL